MLEDETTPDNEVRKENLAYFLSADDTNHLLKAEVWSKNFIGALARYL